MRDEMSQRIEWNTIRLVPILHNKLEFALEVQRQFQEFMPDCVAVEFPDTLKGKIIQGIRRFPLLSVVYYQEKGGDFTYLLLEPTDGQVEAVRLALERNIPIHFIDRDTEGYPRDRTPMPDSYALSRIGLFKYWHAYLEINGNRRPCREDRLREKKMAFHLQQLAAKKKKVFFVGGMFHLPGILLDLDQPQTDVIGRRYRDGVGLAHLHGDSSREVLSEMPYIVTAFEKNRSMRGDKEMDRILIHEALIRSASEQYRKNNKEDVNPAQMEVLRRFSRNYALLSGDLVPSFYQLVVSARGAVDDDFAYEIWELGSHYPWQDEAPDLPVIKLTGEDLFLGQKRIRFHRRLKALRRRLVPVPAKKRVREKTPGEWQKHFDGHSICSYPPEDVVVEGYGQYLQKKALEIKLEENSRIVPFLSSMMDGIDIRQTIREWQGGKIYVKENRPLQGKVGSVVVIFDPDHPNSDGKEQYPWKVTWLGEHDQESDMAFYSTPAGDLMDGPGISRCQYGGFMLTYPPLRVYDIWKDPFYHMARTKPERLLMAAIEYSLEKHVVYVAAEPPSGWCQSMASRMGKKIIYLPKGAFSPVTLKKIRQFHVLDGHHVRAYAPRFIR
jgi:hypothetical protein